MSEKRNTRRRWLAYFDNLRRSRDLSLDVDIFVRCHHSHDSCNLSNSYARSFVIKNVFGHTLCVGCHARSTSRSDSNARARLSSQLSVIFQSGELPSDGMSKGRTFDNAAVRIWAVYCITRAARGDQRAKPVSEPESRIYMISRERVIHGPVMNKAWNRF